MTTPNTTSRNSDHNHEGHTPAPKNPALADNTHFEMTLPKALVEPSYKKFVTQFAAQVKMPGFRAGKVPAAVAEKQLDQERLVTAVLRDVVPALLEEEFKKAGDKYQPISQPSVQPDSTLQGADWKITVSFAEPPIIKVTDYKKSVAKAVKDALLDIAEEKKTKEKNKKPAAVSMTADEEKEIKLRHIFKNLVTDVAPAIPELLVREETQYRLENFARSLQQFKMELQDYLKHRQTTLDQIIAEFQAEAIGSLQIEFILSEIGKVAAIKVTDAHKKAALAEITDDKLKAHYATDPSYQSRLESTLLRRNIIEHLLSLA